MNRIVIALLVLALFAGLSSAFVVDETDQVIITRFGQYRKTVEQPGLYFKTPFVDSVFRMERRILGSDTPPSEYLTLDKKRLVADPAIRWRIEDPIRFYKTVGDELSARKRLDDIVQSEMRQELGNMKFGDVIGNARDPLMQKVRDRVAAKTKAFGIHTVDVRIKRADLPSQVQESVFARMQAERDRVAKGYKSEGEEEAAKIRADADKEETIIVAKAYETAQKLRGEGDAEGIRIYAEAYSKNPEFYAFVRSLETYEKAIDPGSQVVLSTGSELFKYLNAPKKR